MLWRLSRDGSSVAGVAAAIPMPLMHTVELNAGTVDTDAGPQLRAGWTWAPSALDQAQVSRLSRLWFDALAGICAHVRGGGGGLTPSDIAPARLSQPQIDELARQYDIADILPLTPLQQGLLFHASTAHGRRRCVCGAAGYHVERPARPAPAARCRADRGHPASQPGGPILRTVRRAGADHPGRSRGALAVCRSEHVDGRRSGRLRTLKADPAGVRRRTRRGLRPGRPAGLSGGVDPHRSRSAPVRADQSPHRAGWLVAADPAGGDVRQLLRAAAARGRAVSQVRHLAGRSGSRCRPRGLA